MLGRCLTHHMNPDCHPIVQQLRQDLLDDLYRRDGRDDPSHPFHSLYTNLFQSYTEAHERS